MKTDSSISLFSNLFGFIFSAATAYIYEFVHRAKSIEEKCIVHLSISLAATEFVIFLTFIDVDDIYSYRISEATRVISTLGLSSFIWSLILTLNVKKKFTPRLGETSTNLQSTSNDAELMKKYFLFGYGFPLLVFLCYWGRYDLRDWAELSTIYASVAIIVLTGLTLFNLSKDLSRQIDNAQASLTSNDPVKVDIQQLEYRQQFAKRLFQNLALPWFILFAVIFVVIITNGPDSSVMTTVTIVGPTLVFGLQGIFAFLNLVLLRKRIWKDLRSEYGWQKPTEVKNLEDMLGCISEDDDDDEEKIQKSQTRFDFLTMIDHLTRNNEPKTQETNQLPNPKVYSERETQNMQPTIHQYSRGVVPGAAGHTDPFKQPHETV